MQCGNCHGCVTGGHCYHPLSATTSGERDAALRAALVTAEAALLKVRGAQNLIREAAMPRGATQDLMAVFS